MEESTEVPRRGTVPSTIVLPTIGAACMFYAKPPADHRSADPLTYKGKNT